MKKIVLGKCMGLFLLGAICYSCSSEESLPSKNTALTKEEVLNFRTALREYELNKYGKDTAIKAATFESMVAQSRSYLVAAGISESTIASLSSKNELIVKAIIEFAKSDVSNNKSSL